MRTFMIGAALFAAAHMAVMVAPKAEVIHYKATLNGASETPPTTSAGTGSLTATFDTDSKKLEWTADYSGLTGPAIAAHFHGPAPVGKAAPIEVPLQAPLDSPMKGSATLTDAQAKDLMDGMMYFNIHTAANKPGEIRGQMEKAM
jgi:CHRD domain-containing protein